MIKDYFKLVSKGIIKRGLRSWLTMIGIFIGIAAVVALIGLGEGLREAVNSQFGFLGTDFITVMASSGFGAPGSGTVNSLTEKELNDVKSVSGIEDAAGRLLEAGKLEYNDVVDFTFVVSMPDGDARKLIEDSISLKAFKGRLLEDGDSGVVLGYGFYDDDKFGKQILPGAKVKIQEQEFKVVGIMEKKGNLQIDHAILMNEDDVRDLFSVPSDEYDIIAAKFDQSADVEKIKKDIEKKIRKTRSVDEGEEDFSVETPTNIIESVNEILLGIQIFIYIIAGISLLVGGIGIMNTMYTSVVERTRDIGIMKSIGARNSSIFSLFFIESGLIGSIGGLVGIIFGYLAATGLAYAGKMALGTDLISANISIELIAGALLFSFILGSVFGTLPAIAASKLNPVDALRYAK